MALLVLIAFLEAHAETMRLELAGPSPSPLERLLVDRIVVSWLLANQLDKLDKLDKLDLADACAGGRALALAEYDNDARRADRAHRRLLAAL